MQHHCKRKLSPAARPLRLNRTERAVISFRCQRALGWQAAKKRERFFFLSPHPAASPRVSEEGWEPVRAWGHQPLCLPVPATGRPAAQPRPELALTSG